MKIKFKNKTTIDTARVKIVPKNGAVITPALDETNPTVLINNGELSFCLSPLSETILSCEGATNEATVDLYGRWYWMVILDDYIVCNFRELRTEADQAFLDLSDIEMPQDILEKISKITLKLSTSNPMVDGYNQLTFINHNDTDVKLEVQANRSREYLYLNNFSIIEQENKSIIYEDEVDGYYEKVSFCLVGPSCLPTLVEGVDTGLDKGGAVRITYRINAPNHDINNEEGEYFGLDYNAGTPIIGLFEAMLTQIQESYLFIKIGYGSVSGIFNFKISYLNSFTLLGCNGSHSSDPISITIIRTNLDGDLFSQLFPEELTDQVVVHSCGEEFFEYN